MHNNVVRLPRVQTRTDAIFHKWNLPWCKFSEDTPISKKINLQRSEPFHYSPTSKCHVTWKNSLIWSWIYHRSYTNCETVCSHIPNSPKNSSQDNSSGLECPCNMKLFTNKKSSNSVFYLFLIESAQDSIVPPPPP